MTTTTTTAHAYEVAGLSALERQGVHPDTCAECGREALVHPVKLKGPHGAVWVGTGCAALLLFGAADKVSRARAERAARAATREVVSAEAQAAALAGSAKLASFSDWLTEQVGPHADGVFGQCSLLGGPAEAHRLHRAATVA
jgi:hypothetical protein